MLIQANEDVIITEAERRAAACAPWLAAMQTDRPAMRRRRQTAAHRNQPTSLACIRHSDLPAL